MTLSIGFPSHKKRRDRRNAAFAAVMVAASVQAAPPTGADYLINVWDSENGLPQNSVNCLAQTPDGYLWVGTRSGGLARFDGSRFVIFSPQTTPGLKDVEIESLSVDSRGALWVTTGNESISRLAHGRFHLVREPDAEPRWHPLQIPIVMEDSHAVYFAAYGSAVFRVPRDGKLNGALRIPLAPPPYGALPNQFCQAADGALWYLTSNRAVARMQYHGSDHVQFKVFQPGGPSESLAKDEAGNIWVAAGRRFGVMTSNGFSDRTPDNSPPLHEIHQIIPTKDGSVWVWDGYQLQKFSQGKWTTTAPDFNPSPDHEPLFFFADSRGGLWVIEYGIGLWHIRTNGASVLLSLTNGLPSKFITCWLEDTEGNIWVGTKEAGLVRIRRRLFREYTATAGIPGNVAQSVCEDAQNTLWVGTATGGLAYQAGDRFIPVSLTPNPDPLIESVTVCPDATNGIWIGTLEGRIFRYANGKVHPVNTDVTWSFPLERLRDHVANAMMEDRQGRVWFCNGSGAFYFQNGVFSAFDRSRGFVDNIGVRAIAEGPPGTLWFGTEPGDVWQLVDNRLTKFSPPKTWPNARVAALLPDTDNSVWIGTLGDGLLHLKNGNFTRVTAQDGLPDNSITELLEDNEGNLWGGTYKGIFRVAKEDLARLAGGLTNEIAISVFGHFDGLPAQTYSGWFQPSCWRSHDGRLWFTTIKGLVVVNPAEVTVNHHSPSVIIEEMRVDGESCDFNSLVNDNHRSLRIAPGRHYVEFRFTGINLTAPDKLRFKWRLEGVEKNWHENTSQRTVGFGPLIPGNYRFQVFAANSDGIWNQTGASVTFTILPFFWETWWFKTLLIAAFCSGLALAATLGLHRRHRLALERIERGHAIERERARIARDMHDEIGSKLARISYLSEIVKAEAQDPAPNEATVDSLSKTARDLLQSFDQMLWVVNPRNDSLERLSAYLNRYAAEYFQNAPICCRRTFPENLPAIQLTAETRHNIFLAFQEALANVLQHSAATQVDVGLRCDGNAIQIFVADNGRGFKVEPLCEIRAKFEAGEHLGLSSMYHRLNSIGGECQIRSSPNQGTLIEFTLPLYHTNDR